MPKDDSAPFTKADGKMILEIMNQILVRLDEHSRRFDEHSKLLHEHSRSFDTLREENALLVENLRADVLDARKDQVALHQDCLNDHDHDRRIVRLERKVAV